MADLDKAGKLGSCLFLTMHTKILYSFLFIKS